MLARLSAALMLATRANVLPGQSTEGLRIWILICPQLVPATLERHVSLREGVAGEEPGWLPRW